ncbi:MAG: ATP-dependent zinc metalloprotease FtsH [Patescibacteria group bacterium]
MANLYKHIFLGVMALLLIVAIFSLLLGSSAEPEKLTLDQLAAKIAAGEVAKISVSGNDLDVELKGGAKAAAKKEFDSSLSETLVNYGASPEALRAVAIEIQDESGLRFWTAILLPVLLPLLIIGAIFWFVFRQARSGANQAFSFGKINIRLFAPFKDRVTFADVAGLKEAKEELLEIVDFLKNPKKFLDIGAKIPRGVLLMGGPGTGKTLLARAVAGEAGVPFFHISGSEFVEMFVGVGASRVRDLFQTAKKSPPAIIFIDEIDAVGRHRGAGLGGGHDAREQPLNQILVEMDGFERDTNLIVMAATNRPDILDPALLRPGRFDRRVFLDAPDINDREQILKIHAKGKPLDKGVDLRKIAVRTPGFSGADLANLINEAAILAARQNRRVVSQDDLYNSIEKVILGPERKSRAISAKEKEIIAYHEAGHALMAASLKDADPVHKVSIVSRGRAGGYTLKLPVEDVHLRFKSQFLADLAVMLGGFVSEELVFSELSTGASSDLKEATGLARRIVTQYGMSDKLGPMTFGRHDGALFLGREIHAERDYSEEIASKIDGEVRNFIDRAYKNAKKIIASRRKLLDAIAKTLLEKETLEQEEFNQIVKKFNLKPLAA